jgi:hypothetical protein
MAGGWADHHRDDGRRRSLAPGYAGKGTVILTDMPAARPEPADRHIKGVPGPTLAGTDEDHQPGGGLWREVTR